MAETSILAEAEHLFKVLAIIGGGLWAYYQYFRGRTFTPRLVTMLSGSIASTAKGHELLQVTATLRNVGLSKMLIESEVSALRVLEYKGSKDVSFVDSVTWDAVATLKAFDRR